MVDYSKWKDIEVSDDEDDIHPNIDTPSLFRWRHEARVNRMKEQEDEQKEFENKVQTHAKRKKDIETRKKNGEDVKELEEEWQKEEDQIQKAKEELDKKAKLTPWNVDTIAKPGFSVTKINNPKKSDKKELTEEERAKNLRDFTKNHEAECKKFALLRKFDDSKKFLLDNPHLACEESANFLVLWCVELAMLDKHELMHHVAHQVIAMQFLLELAKQLDVDPRSCIGSFFSKIAMAENTEYKQAFDVELKAFIQRIEARAEERIREAMEEERKERLGPGGLDPLEVMEELPEDLQRCFETKDIELLKDTIAKYPVEEGRVYLQKCIDSGLWIPDAKAHQAEQEAAEKAEAGEGASDQSKKE